MQGSMVGGRRLAVLGCVLGALLVPQAAQAAPPASVFGGAVTCNVQTNGVDFCSNFGPNPRSTVPAFDGVPIDVNVAFPPSADFGPDGTYPLIMMFHGYGGGKLGLGSMQHWLDRGYATFSMTDRGFRESCGSAASRTAARHGVRRRLRAPDRQPLRGPRRAGVRRPARRRGPDRPAADRRDRRLLRRRHVDGARRAQEPQGAARLQPRPLDEPGRQADADRGGRAEHPLDRPRLLAAAERQHARLRRRRSLHRAGSGSRSSRSSAGSTSPGSAPPGFYAPVGTRPDCRPHRLAHAARTRASRTAPSAQADRRRDHPAPLLVLHRSLDRPGADADVERVHRRPLPGRRDDPLLQPHPDPVRRQPTWRCSSATSVTRARRTRAT